MGKSFNKCLMMVLPWVFRCLHDDELLVNFLYMIPVCSWCVGWSARCSGVDASSH